MLNKSSHFQMGMLIWLSACLSVLTTPAALADHYLDEGVRLYNLKNYRAAQPYFDQVRKTAPFTRAAYYYEALCYQQLGLSDNAKQLYKEICEKFGGSQEAQFSATVLRQIDPGYLNRCPGRPTASVSSPAPTSQSGPLNSQSLQSSALSAAELRSLPDEAKVPFTRATSEHLYVDAEVNGRPIRVLFDTGAFACMFGKNHFRAAGISVPDTGSRMKVGGSTGGHVMAMISSAEIKVGPIRRTIAITVMDEMPTAPLLGENFFGAFEYDIDNQGGFIHFKKKGSRTAQPIDAVEVPFVPVGNNFRVLAELNGQPCWMLFDTGCNDISFPLSFVSAYGIKIPEEVRVRMSGGIDGVTRTYELPVERIKLGPVVKTNIMATFSETGTTPLLGQTFFKDKRFTIDNEKKVIRFWH